MYFDSTSHSNRGASQWDPDTVLEIENPLTGYVTCVGEARTYHRRCKRRVGGASSGRDILTSLSMLDPMTASRSSRLVRAASAMLCYQHGAQASEVASEWGTLLESYGSRTQERSQPRNDRPAKSQQPKYASGQDSYAELLEKLRRLEEELQNFRKKEQRKAEEEERQKREQQQEKANRERDARENEAANRAQARRTAREKKEAEEKQSWRDAWSRYSSQWDTIETSNERGSKQQIPWPTKSGKWQDVTEAEVRQFFLKAQPVQSSPSPEEERYRLMTVESKRWHTDKIPSRFGRCILDGPQGAALNTIARAVVQLWKEAKMQRKI